MNYYHRIDGFWNDRSCSRRGESANSCRIGKGNCKRDGHVFWGDHIDVYDDINEEAKAPHTNL